MRLPQPFCSQALVLRFLLLSNSQCNRWSGDFRYSRVQTALPVADFRGQPVPINGACMRSSRSGGYHEAPRVPPLLILTTGSADWRGGDPAFLLGPRNLPVPLPVVEE